MRSLLSCLTVVSLCAALAAPASAATVSTDGGTLRVAALTGEENALAVYETDVDGLPAVAIRDDTATLLAGAGCMADLYDGAVVTCPASGLTELVLDAGDGDDRVDIGIALPTRIDGGAGDDELAGGEGPDRLDVGGGYDRADGGGGADVILMRDRRTDAASCGSGRDSVRAEVLDSLDVACERVDYGPAGRVGRLHPVTGGGAFVPVPGQPWALVDRRILRNVLYLVRRYHVRIGDGYARQGHERLGEHPLGLAVDLYPGAGGSWRDVARLARWAEPRQNRPRWPFRWVGWNGDFNHGWGNHLHLSWAHSPGRPGRPVKTAWVFAVER